ncbi:MAG: flagellar basal body P-ring protein FlgI [Myxococcota bacterium]
MWRRNLLLTLLLALLPTTGHAGARLKELADVRGVRDNMLLGYGLVVGLSGTGDSEQVLFTVQSLSGMLGRLGVRVSPQDIRMRNVAAVMVTARLPAFMRPGSSIDVHVSSLGNARSLSGGVLLLTPLQGPDGNVYALSQGPVQVGGFDASTPGGAVRKNQATTGHIPGGGVVEKAVMPALEGAPLVLDLKKPDFTTAERVARAINESQGMNVATALDAAAVEVRFPPEHVGQTVAFISRLEQLEVEPDRRARVVISERTGTVVAGEGVRIRAVAIAHGGLQVTVASRPVISQPGPFSSGKTVAAQQDQVDAREERNAVVALPATATVQELVQALNALGVTPRDLISILQAIKAAGALDAELEVL